MSAPRIPKDWLFDHVHDAMDRGCGELLMELKQRVDELPGGSRLALVSRDAGSPIEIPSWCRLTGHRLEASAHPCYLIVTRS